MTNIIGTNSNEQLFGTSLADVIHSLFGDDTIYSRQKESSAKHSLRECAAPLVPHSIIRSKHL